MKILTPGHEYLLSNIKTDNRDENANTLKFYNEKCVDKDEIVGTSNQEVLRALIDRVNYLDNELPHSFNKEIIFHLRKALALHEARHLTRMVDKDVAVENFPVGDDGHFICLDKEKEYFYQDEIVQNDLARYNGSTLTDAEKEFAKGLTAKINTATRGAISLLFPQKEEQRYEKKKLFLDPEEDRLVMDNKDIPTITEVAYDKNKTSETIENSTVIKILAKNEDQIYNPEKCSSIDFYSGNAEELLAPEAILDTIVINTNKASFSVDKDTLLTMFSSVYKNNKDIGKIVYSDNLYTTSMIGLEKDIAIFMFRDHHPVKQKEIKYIKELENEKVILTTLATTELSLIGNKEFFMPIDVVLVVTEVTYKDRNSFVLSVSKDGYGINNLVTINMDNFVYKSLDTILADNSLGKVYINKDIKTLQPKEELNPLDNKLPQDKYFIYVGKRYVGKRNMLLQKLLAIPFVSNNNILDVTNVIFDHFVYIPNSLLIKKLFKGNLVNIQEIKVELVKQELNSNVKDLINSSINCNKHCDSSILVEYNVNTNTIIDKSTGKLTYKKEKVNSTYFFIFYIKYNNHKG